MKIFIRLMALLICATMMMGLLTACSGEKSGDASSKSSSKLTSSTASSVQSDGTSEDGTSEASSSNNSDSSAPASSGNSSGNSSSTSSSASSDNSSQSTLPVVADKVSYRASSANKQVKNLKILPVGDSLTYGSGCLSGWRYQTYKNLYSAGITFEFVGPYSSPWDRRLGSRYNKHAGWSGRNIQNIIDKADEIFKRDFDVVFLMIGHNDKGDLSVKKMALYRSLIDKIYTYNSNAVVFCMGIAPDYSQDNKFTNFNKYIESMCSNMKKSGREIYYASTDSPNWDKVTCFTDWVHFSEEGNKVVADCLTKVAIPVLQKLNVADTSYTVPVSPSSITLDKSSLSLTAYNGFSQGAQLTATVNPTDAAVKNVVWGSSNRNVATVDENGIVRAVGAGKCTVTAYTLDGGKKASCSVTVNAGGGETLFSDNFANDSKWDGKQTTYISCDMYRCDQLSKAEPLTTKSSFNAGKKFYFSMNTRVFKYNENLPKIKDDGYALIRYGNLEIRENQNGRTITVLCDSQKVCEYNYGTFTVELVEYGLLYDNGKVSLMRNGVEVATGTATFKGEKSAISVASAESKSTVNFRNVKLVKF